MNVPVTVNGVTVEIPIDDAVIEQAVKAKKKSEKKTGYERHERGQYYFQATGGAVDMDAEVDHSVDQKRYQAGNYYTSQKVAVSNARADNLMRNLRRFAAEHGGCGSPKAADSTSANSRDWTIVCVNGEIKAKRIFPKVGAILFKDEDAVKSAIEAFRDELTWYFTQWDPMPEGWWED